MLSAESSKNDLLRHLMHCSEIRANYDERLQTVYKPEQFVRATAMCIIPYIFYSI